MKKYLFIACCLSIQHVIAVTVLERTGKKSSLGYTEVKSPLLSDDSLSNPHMPQMVRPSINRNLMCKNFSGKEIKEVFTEIYRENFWLGTKSRSGQGSTLVTTEIIRTELVHLWDELKIEKILDAGCGDYYWMRTVDMKNRLYIGVDIVAEMIEKNRIAYGDEQHYFLCLNLAEDFLPKVDMIICRDVLAHLDYETACKVLRNLKASGSTFLLATNHQSGKPNKPITAGNHHPYDLALSPFNLPEPLVVIEEMTAEAESFKDGKTMGLWLLQDLNLDDLEY